MSAIDDPLILVIDDELAVRRSIVGYLDDSGYRLIQTDNGRKGIELFEQAKPDLVLVDLRMPEMDGLEVLSSISQQAPNTPTVVVSGTGVIADAVEALHHGAWDYILKPIEDMSILKHAVEKALERALLIRENALHQQQLEDQIEQRTKELQQANKGLAVSEERYRLLTETITDNIWIIDINTLELVYTSSSTEHILGYTPDEMRAIDLEKVILPESWKQINYLIEGVMAQGSVTTSDETKSHVMEVAQRHKDGHTVWTEIKGRLVRDKDGNPSQIWGVTRDISERRALEAQIRQAQRMESVGLLAGGVAHDFNNLLTPILSYAEMLMMDMPQQDPRYQDLAQIKETAERAKILVRQLLTLSRNETIETKVIDLGKIVTDFQSIMRRTIREDIDIRSVVDSTECPIAGDASSIEQILLNLAVNSQDSMPNGGKMTIVVSGTITNRPQTSIIPPFAAQETGPFIKLTFSDTGCGMEAPILERIFEPFYSTKKPGKGTGLGLATVYGIVEKHKGSISVQSQPGSGTQFEILFPMSDSPDLSMDSQPLEVIHRTGMETILVVEDDDLVRNLAQTILTRHGYNVIVGEDPNQALVLANEYEGQIHLLLTDVIMPQMNGKDLHRKLLSILSDIKVLYMSGHTDDIIADQGVLEEGIAFLQKPFSVPVLIKKVHEVINA